MGFEPTDGFPSPDFEFYRLFLYPFRAVSVRVISSVRKMLAIACKSDELTQNDTKTQGTDTGSNKEHFFRKRCFFLRAGKKIGKKTGKKKVKP